MAVSGKANGWVQQQRGSGYLFKSLSACPNSRNRTSSACSRLSMLMFTATPKPPAARAARYRTAGRPEVAVAPASGASDAPGGASIHRPRRLPPASRVRRRPMPARAGGQPSTANPAASELRPCKPCREQLRLAGLLLKRAAQGQGDYGGGFGGMGGVGSAGASSCGAAVAYGSKRSGDVGMAMA